MCAQKSTLQDRLDKIETWDARGGVLVLGYEMFRLLTYSDEAEADDEPGVVVARRADPVSHDLRERFRVCLCSPGPDIVRGAVVVARGR